MQSISMHALCTHCTSERSLKMDIQAMGIRIIGGNHLKNSSKQPINTPDQIPLLRIFYSEEGRSFFSLCLCTGNKEVLAVVCRSCSRTTVRRFYKHLSGLTIVSYGTHHWKALNKYFLKILIVFGKECTKHI
jgi:hypothetical protein